MARVRPLTTIGNDQGAAGPARRLRDKPKPPARHQQERPVDVPRYLPALPEQKRIRGRHLEIHALRVRKPQRHAALHRRLIHQQRQETASTSSGKATRKPRRRLSRHRQPAARQTGPDLRQGKRTLRCRGISDQLSNMGQRQGRNGSSIWLHGVPFDTYSRPPRASAVVWRSPRILKPSAGTSDRAYTVIIANNVEWVSPDAAKSLREELAERGNMAARLGKHRPREISTHYSATFSSGKQNLKDWSQQKRQVNAGKPGSRSKSTSSTCFYPGMDNMAVVTFVRVSTTTFSIRCASANAGSRKQKRKIVYEGRHKTGE